MRKHQSAKQGSSHISNHNLGVMNNYRLKQLLCTVTSTIKLCKLKLESYASLPINGFIYSNN